MKRLVDSRARLLRVRSVQHNLAAREAAQAAQRVDDLERNRTRVAGLRADLVARVGVSSGAAMARSAELAMRLDQASVQLANVVQTARDVAAAQNLLRIHARRDEEGAEKLHHAAMKGQARQDEKKMSGLFRCIKRSMKEDFTQ